MRGWADEDFEPLPTTATLAARRGPLLVESESDKAAYDSDDGDEIVGRFGGLGLGSSAESETEEETLMLPAHACSYCGTHEIETVVRCSGCNRWFCNGSHGTSNAGSHILQHLVRARHKEISLHPDSDLGDAVLECYNCGCRNIFLLGWIPSKAETVVVLLCRTPCASSASEDAGWDAEGWQPLISNRALLSWIAAPPSEAAPCRRVTMNQIMRLEEVWRSRPDATIEDMDMRAEEEAELVPVKVCYESTLEYQSILAPLVSVEAECDRLIKEAQKLEGISIRWDRGLNLSHLAFFSLPRAADEYRIAMGDELVIKHPCRKGFQATGIIIKNPLRMLATEELCVEVRGGNRVPDDLSSGYSVEFVWKSTSYDRMLQALRQFALDPTCVDPRITNQLLGQSSLIDHQTTQQTLKAINAPGLPELNHSQAQAVRSVLNRPLALIQGPPGTGKTVTSATIVYHLACLNQGPVLVTAPSNVAVDHLTEKIHQTGLRVVRLAAKWREDVDTAVSFLSLHEQIRNYSGKPELQKLIQLRDERGELSKSDEGRYFKLLRATESEILKVIPIVVIITIIYGFR